MAEWAFITNHAAVLLKVAKNPRITAREIAVGTGISERAIRKIIADLDREHYISKKRDGRHVIYTIYPDKPLRHFSVDDITVGKLLGALGWPNEISKERIPVPAGTRNKSAFRNYQTTEQEEKSIDNIYSSQLF